MNTVCGSGPPSSKGHDGTRAGSGESKKSAQGYGMASTRQSAKEIRSSPLEKGQERRWEVFGEILCLSCSALPLASVCGCCGVSGGAEPALPYLKSGMWLRG